MILLKSVGARERFQVVAVVEVVEAVVAVDT